MKLDDLFPSRYLKAADLQGREVPVTISHVAVEQMQTQSGTETKGVVYFKAHSKGLVLNQVNATTIGEAYGQETDNWGNSPIVLYPTRTQFGAKMVDCIRIKIPGQPAPPETPIADHSDAAAGDDDVPF
jgi:hypothetical protein